ncbi:MAG: DUF433 domain-containing protein [Burkholderiales bacterium]
MPVYTIVEAAGYLRLSKSMLRTWMLGQKGVPSVINIADRSGRRLSFINLVEAFVLAGIHREHSIPLPKMRMAVACLRRKFKTKHPLAEKQFATDGVDLFVEKLGQHIGGAQHGQLRLREIILDRLKHVRRDPKGIPEKIVLFPALGDAPVGDVVIDPRLSFGRPVLDGFGLRTAMVAERFEAGEQVEELAKDYDVLPAVIENAIRCERRAA